jgi:Holliday junction resolvasome RuvABC DNA-binding subunit
MTKRQLARAARLYALSVLSNQDCGGAESEVERQVMEHAINEAGSALARLGYEPTELASITKCIDAAMTQR